MKYKELRSIYYEDSENYAQEYKKRFDSEETVKLNFEIKGNQAFFLQNLQIITIAYEILKLDKTIDELCRRLPGVALKQYSRKCLIDEIVLTNKIEGVHSSRKEIGEVLDTLEMQSKAKKKESRLIGIVNKYLMLLEQEHIQLENSKDVRKIYDDVFLEEILSEDSSNKPDGEIFRKNLVSVHSETEKVIHNGLTPESKIIEAMEHALGFLNDDSIDELFRVCIFHYLIEYIHPFYDGNGRLGRLIFSYGLAKVFSPLISLRISGTIKQNIEKYYKAFKTCNDAKNLGDLTPFLIMQLEMVKIAMEDLKESLMRKLITWDNYERAIEKIHFSDVKHRALFSYLIQAALFSEKGISMQELVENMKCSKYIINNLLKQINSEMISIKKKGNQKFYSINLDKLDNDILKEKLTDINSPE